MMKKSLRLLVTKQCNRHCIGCCNKDWDLNNLPIFKSAKGFKEILITGGEPLLIDYMIFKIMLLDILKQADNDAKVYIYTSYNKNINKLINFIVELSDGITFTIHEQKDVNKFITLNKKLQSINDLFALRSMRLNIFKGIDLGKEDLTGWKIQKDMIWIKDCPLPKNEVFMKYQ